MLKVHHQYDPELHKRQTELIKESFVAKTHGLVEKTPAALLEKKLAEQPEVIEKAVIGGTI